MRAGWKHSAATKQAISRKAKRKDDRNAKLIARYKSGATLRELAAEFEVSLQRVHQIIETYAPGLMREPYVVPPHRRPKKRVQS